MSESWRPITGFEGFYEVSDTGKVRSYRYQGSAWKKRKVPKVIKLNRNLQTGYVYVRLYVREKRARLPVHRLVLETFVGPCPAGCETCHGNGIKDDNRVENLRWGSHTSNMAESKNVKLTSTQVEEIRTLYNAGERQTTIAEQFGVTQACVSLIVNHKHRSRT